MQVTFAQALVLLSNLLLVIAAVWRIGRLLERIEVEMRHANERLVFMDERVIQIEKKVHSWQQ